MASSGHPYGHVTTESTVDVGTPVALYLPKATQIPDAKVEAIQLDAIPHGSEQILVVEDNEDLLEAIFQGVSMRIAIRGPPSCTTGRSRKALSYP
jgi:hypothetical protein